MGREADVHETEQLLERLGLGRLEDRFSYQGLMSGGKGGCITCIYFDDKTKRSVVVKIHISPTEDQLRRLNFEANVLSEFQGAEAVFIHRPVIGITPVNKIDHLPVYYFVMEHAEGISLHDYLSTLNFPKEELPWEVPVEISLRIAQALSIVARHNVVHRDLHDRNVIICEHDSSAGVGCTVKQTRIIDLGCGRVDSRNRKIVDEFWEETGNLAFFFHAGCLYDPRKSWQTCEGANDHLYTRRPLGAWSVMAPEILADPHSADGKADIWSLGALLYYMLTSRFPFENPHLDLLLEEMRQRKYKPLSEFRKDLPVILSDVVDLFLEPDSQRRIEHKSVGYMLVDLLEIAADFWEAHPDFSNDYVKHHGEVRCCARCKEFSFTPNKCQNCGCVFGSEESFWDWAAHISGGPGRIRTVNSMHFKV